MENLRELLNIYFSEAEEKPEDRPEEINENTYENIFNTFNKEEKHITNVLKEILNYNNTELQTVGGGFESIIEKAFKGAGKIGDTDAAYYYNYGGGLKNENYTGGAETESYENNYTGGDVLKSENYYGGGDAQNKEVYYSEGKGLNSEKFYSQTKEIKEEEGQEAVLRDTVSYINENGSGFFDNSFDEDSVNEALSENVFNYDYKNGGAEGLAGRAGFSAFVPSQGSFAESYSNVLNERAGDESINDILNNYYGNTEGSRSITNNISPAFNFYGSSGAGEIDIDEIAEKIGEMLSEAAAGSADGFYG